jgi:CBS domain-containing protein
MSEAPPTLGLDGITPPEMRTAAYAEVRFRTSLDPSGSKSVLEASSRDLVVTYPDEVLYDAAARMLRANVGRLPVVNRKEPHQAMGYLGRSSIMAARQRQLEEEYVRDPGWLPGRKTAS